MNKLYLRLDPPFEWVRTLGSSIESFGEVSDPQEYPLGNEEELIGVVSGECVTVHRLSLPAKSRRQFSIALPYALEEGLTQEIDDLHFVCPDWKAGQDSIVFVAAKQRMQEWQALANLHKLPLDRLLPDYALLPLHDVAQSTMALVYSNSDQAEKMFVRRKSGEAASLELSFVETWLADIPLSETIAVNDKEAVESFISNYPERDFRYWDIGNKMAHWLEHFDSPKLDLFSDEYRPSVRKFNWRSLVLPGFMALAAVLIVFLFDTYRYFALHAEIKAIHEEQAQILKEHFPSLGDVPNGNAHELMRRAIENKSASAVQGRDTISALASMAKVLNRLKIELNEVSYRDSKLVITCILNDLSQVDMLTRNLNQKTTLSTKLDSSTNVDGRILAVYSLTHAQ